MTINMPIEYSTRAYELKNRDWRVSIIQPLISITWGLLAFITILTMTALHIDYRHVMCAYVEWLVRNPIANHSRPNIDVQMALMNYFAYSWDPAYTLRCRSVWLRARVMREPILIWQDIIWLDVVLWYRYNMNSIYNIIYCYLLLSKSDHIIYIYLSIVFITYSY